MITLLKNAIATAIENTVGNAYTIYLDKVEQGLQEPCFLIRGLTQTNADKLGERKRYTRNFVITFFPSNKDNAVEECDEMHDTLSVALNLITDSNGNKYRYTAIYSEYDIDNQVLHFYVTYEVDVMYQTEKEVTMNEIDINQGTKE